MSVNPFPTSNFDADISCDESIQIDEALVRQHPLYVDLLSRYRSLLDETRYSQIRSSHHNLSQESDFSIIQEKLAQSNQTIHNLHIQNSMLVKQNDELESKMQDANRKMSNMTQEANEHLFDISKCYDSLHMICPDNHVSIHDKLLHLRELLRREREKRKKLNKTVRNGLERLAIQVSGLYSLLCKSPIDERATDFDVLGSQVGELTAKLEDYLKHKHGYSGNQRGSLASSNVKSTVTTPP